MVVEAAIAWSSLAKLSKDTIPSQFSPSQKSLSTYFFLKLLYCQFPNHIPSKSLTIQPNRWPQPIHWYIIAHLTISSSKQMNNQVHCWKFSLGGFSLPLSLRDALERDCSDAAIHFQVVPKYHAEHL